MNKYCSLQKIHQENPLVHVITSQVVANDMANCLLAVGASPIMAIAAEEMEDVAGIAKAIVLNLGMLTTGTFESMLLAGKFGNEKGVPVVLDPVGVGASRFRKEAVSHLLKEVKMQLIRGNAGELAHLADIKWTSKGVDAGEGEASRQEIAERVARRYQTVAAVSGKVDYVSDGWQTAEIQNGHSLLTEVTGTGCMLSGICGAYLAVEKQSPFESTVQACAGYAVAAELAAEKSVVEGPGSFRVAFMDSLSRVTDQDVRENEKVRRYTAELNEEEADE